MWRKIARHVATSPTSGGEGDLIYRTDLDEFFAWDSARSKWLSLGVYEETFLGVNLANGTYMDWNGFTCTATFGYDILYAEMTIVGYSVVRDAAPVGTSTWRVVKNGGAIAQTTLTNPDLDVFVTDTNLDVVQGDILGGFYLTGPNPKPDAYMTVYLKEKAG